MKTCVYRTLLSLAVTIALSGCAMTGTTSGPAGQMLDKDHSLAGQSALQHASICCQNLLAVPYQPLKNASIVIDQNAPVMNFPGGRSYFFAGKIDDVQIGQLVTLDAMIGKSVLPVAVQLLDENYRITRQIPSSHFQLKEGTLLSQYAISGSFQLMPNERYLLIYADAGQYGKTLSLGNPDKIRAQILSQAPEPYPDINVPYAPWGLVDVKIGTDDSVTAMIFNSKPLIGAGNTATPAASTPVVAATSHVTPAPVPMTVPVATASGISTQTRNYYTQAIRTAVKQNQIEQAMQLVDEAQRLGFSDAKTIFVTAVKQK